MTVKAEIPKVNGISVTISRIDESGNWTEASSIDFGKLYFDNNDNIWRSSYYCAVDVGVNTNATDWTITHTRSSIANGSEKLDNNVNVTFMKQINDTEAEKLLEVSYKDSNNQSFAKSKLSGGWLRIYYGIAAGNKDAPGVEPITMEKPYGTYQGSVTLTLTTQ
ncbi:MAG TPA: hypothetical protein EYP78_02900 [Candidatus Omnitrophica bacterium]|nr:hypothetical protein [Candidatus Omnitrophota bacterium]